MSDRAAELGGDLQNAEAVPAILGALARAVWFNAHDGAECPDAHLPDLAGLVAWLPECPADARAEADAALTAAISDVAPPFGEAPTGYQWAPVGAMFFALAANLSAPIPDRPGRDLTYSVMLRLEAVHDAWRAAGGRHPLAPVVSAWQRRPSHRQARNLVNRASLPRLAKLGSDDATLPDFPLQDAPAAPNGQLNLPGFGDAVRGCASWLLWLFDQAGGESLASGRGAPWDLRLFVYALLHLDVADRDGEWHTIRLPTDTVTGWLHPHGWANERRDWDNLPEALRRMSRELSYVPVDGIGYVAMLFPSVIPAKRGDPLVEFTARVPRVAAHGDRLNWPHLLAYGADSARLFRAYLAVTAWLGRSAKRGHPITRQIAAPVHGPDGKPTRRRKGGAIIRSATERIDNPAARYVGPPLSETDLTRMIGFDPSNRKLRQYARAAFERMEADGVIEIERSGAGWLLFGGPNG